jgi:hypothetical protein
MNNYITRKTVVDYNYGQGRPQRRAKDREYVTANLQKFRANFMQIKAMEGDWLVHVRDMGANTIILNGSEIN